VLTPSTYWNDPIVRFGLGVVIGLAVGSRGSRGTAVAATHEGLLHAIVRAGLTAATTALITRALTQANTLAEPDSDGPPDQVSERSTP
jgi:hypothetical protein